MAKSTTPKKSIEIDLEKIRKFTEKELAKLSDASPLPFCYEIGNDIVIVGACKVIRTKDQKWLVKEGNYELFEFFTRKDAIFYCIAVHKQDHHLQQSIIKYDQRIDRLEEETKAYRIRYKQAVEKQDDFKSDLYSIRYVEAKKRLDQLKEELQKSLEMTKYIKPGN